MALQACISRGERRVESVTGVTRVTIQLGVCGTGMHAQARLVGSHRGQSRRQSHAVFSGLKAVRLGGMTSLAPRHCNRRCPSRIIPDRILRLLAVCVAMRAIDACRGVRGFGPIPEDFGIDCFARRGKEFLVVGIGNSQCRSRAKLAGKNSERVSLRCDGNVKVVGLAEVIVEILFVQGAVVVVVMAARRGTTFISHALMTGARVGHLLMTVPAVVRGHRQSHRKGSIRDVFLVATEAILGVKHLQSFGIGRVIELLCRMSVFGQFELIAMASDAGVLHDVLSAGTASLSAWTMTGIAVHLDLIMSMRRLAG